VASSSAEPSLNTLSATEQLAAPDRRAGRGQVAVKSSVIVVIVVVPVLERMQHQSSVRE